MSTLYEITEEYRRLLDMAEDADTDSQAFEDTLESMDAEVEMKADGCAKVMKELELRASGLKAEIDRLSARKKLIENNVERIKKSLEMAMRATGKVKFKTELFSFNIAKNPASLKLADELDFDEIPAEFIVYPAPTIDKALVKDAIKNGAEFEWAHMEQGESLRIK